MQKTQEGSAQRIVSAVRRIAKTVQEEDGRLGIAQPKAKIEGGVGVAFYNANGDIESKAGVIPVEADTQTPEEAEGSGGLSRIKARNFQAITDNLNQGDTADEFEAYDCTTGQKVQIDLAPIQGQEYPLPDGWESYDQPPEDVSYIQNFAYRVGSQIAPTISALEVLLQQNENPDVDWHIIHENPGYGVYWSWPGDANLNRTGPVSGVSCSSAEHQSQAYCNPTPQDLLVEANWPSDSITNLVLKDGSFAASEYDPDAPQAYKDSSPSQIEVCDGLGSRYQLSAVRNGQAMITKMNSDGSIDELGESLIIGTDGKVADVISNKVRDGLL